MSNLNDDLPTLYELHELRDRAKKLRQGGLTALRGIKNISASGKITARDERDAAYYEKWIRSGKEIEAALLVRVQNHRDMSESDEENDHANASDELKERLKTITLKSLFLSLSKSFKLEDDRGDYAVIRVDKRRLGESEGDGLPITEKFIQAIDSTVPVLVAARVMHALVGRAETVFSRATMICYYRIVRELYVAAEPDWTIGAARANAGGDASAFVTGECIRAILAFEAAISRTVAFFKSTRALSERYGRLRAILDHLGPHAEGHPVSLWADRAVKRMWLDWFLSLNPRRGETVVKEVLLNLPEEPTMRSVGEYLGRLPDVLKNYIDEAQGQIVEAGREIKEIREEQNPYVEERDREKGFKRGYTEQEERWYQQTESAHSVAYRAVKRGVRETSKAQEFFPAGDLEALLGRLVTQFEGISRGIHRVLEPAKSYVRGVVNRELALFNTESGRFDAGELAFAAASFGATTDWRPNERLTRACELLIQSLPDSGSLPTRRPFHSNTEGYRLLPIGCEMTRSFAQLLQKNNYPFEPKLVRRMLNIFEEKRIPPPLPAQFGAEEGGERERAAWNFEGAPHPDRPCVWVTAVAVLALDRIVRMLNERINAAVLRHFEVIRPENPHSRLTLNSLLYPDYGLTERAGHEGRSIPIRLEQMRAHISRATLPAAYKSPEGKAERVFSVLLYGPPGTGKTTLVEALALSSGVPLIRLSPSDLTVHGQELLEGRARAVFEALSMLSQAVIILDEFEPILRDRDPDKKRPGAQADDAIYNFLVTGMLPKLIKLNEAAKRQSLVYCLATNFAEGIDRAATRAGRFDLHLPVYHPDPLSRAGAFLYRAAPYLPLGSRDAWRESEMRLLEVVADTTSTSSGELSEAYFKWDVSSPCIRYYLRGGDSKGYKEKELKEWPTGPKAHLTEAEEAERLVINEWERRLTTITLKQMGKDIVRDRLAPPGLEKAAPRGARPRPRRAPRASKKKGG